MIYAQSPIQVFSQFLESPKNCLTPSKGQQGECSTSGSKVCTPQHLSCLFMSIAAPSHPTLATEILALSELLPDVAFFMSDSGVIQHIGGESEQLTGHGKSELIGKQIFELLDDEDHTCVQDTLYGLRNQLVPACFETRILKKCGAAANIQWSGKWLHEHQTIMALARDVSNYKPVDKLSRGLIHASTPLAHYEKRVLELLLTEASEKQIADKLGLTVSTTHSYVTGIFRKFKVRGRAGLMSLWIHS